ncbi:MAG TPA: ElyC/SanA/YdcF family protein [Anaerolineaceae bacterium]|nr:ElyC/SanA/YdcF family protein [Anaerolineaceae bacterium]
MLLKLVLFSILLLLVLFGLPKVVTSLSAAGRIYSVADAPSAPVAVVFGAGLQKDGTPSPVLKDRVTAAVQLYQAGKVKKLLMSGDNRFVDYNEPASMRDYALSQGVPEEAIVLDFAGRRTYDTCYRARDIFGLDDILVVTQKFHLPRAIFTCSGMGMKVNGVIADLRDYHDHAERFWHIREVPATLVALWQVWVSKPLPVLGKPEPIFAEQSDNH